LLYVFNLFNQYQKFPWPGIKKILSFVEKKFPMGHAIFSYEIKNIFPGPCDFIFCRKKKGTNAMRVFSYEKRKDQHKQTTDYSVRRTFDIM